MDMKLLRREEADQAIRVGVVGAGQMGRGLVSQMALMKGITPAIVSATTAERAKQAFLNAGIPADCIAVAKTADEAAYYMESGKYVATDDFSLVSSTGPVDCVVDATGIPDVGAKVATETIRGGKHIVMLNVETDVVIGPYLKSLADAQGVIYTGSAGDEPGSVMELYSFARAMGMDVLVVGKGKNNGLNQTANPDTMQEEAIRRKMNPKMLTSFRDGTKTMVELAAMSNATGFVPDTVGAHGVASDVMGLNQLYKLKSDSGILNRHGVVEYVEGIAPGVFVTVTSDNEEVAYQLDYLALGPGPLWTFYRPYHLCSLETPLTVAKCVMDNEATIVPRGGLVSECVAVAKKDLAAGELLDGIGGYTAYGTVMEKSQSDPAGYLPFGLITPGCKMRQAAKQGQFLTYDMVELDETTLIYQLRKAQDAMTF